MDQVGEKKIIIAVLMASTWMMDIGSLLFIIS